MLEQLLNTDNLRKIYKDLPSYLATKEALLPAWPEFVSSIAKLATDVLTDDEKIWLLKLALLTTKQSQDPCELKLLLSAVLMLAQQGEFLLWFEGAVKYFDPAATLKLEELCQYSRLLAELSGDVDRVELLDDMRRSPSLSSLNQRLNKKYEDQNTGDAPPRNLHHLFDEYRQANDGLGISVSEEEARCFMEDVAEIKEAQLRFSRQTYEDLRLEAACLAEAYHRGENKEESQHRLIAILSIFIKKHYGIDLHLTQLLSLLVLINHPEELRGRMAEIKTGEGKSSIIAILAAFKALCGDFVDVVTSTHYLASRDEAKYKPFYADLGLTSSCIEYGQSEQKDFHAQILYGENKDFEFTQMADGLYNKKLRYSKRKGETAIIPRSFDVLIVDEVDNFLIDTAQSGAKMSLPHSEHLTWIYQPIYDFVLEQGNVDEDEEPSDELIAEMRTCLAQNVPADQAAQLNKQGNERLKIWLKSAQKAAFQQQEKSDYVIHIENSGKRSIVIVDKEHTGSLHYGCRWKDGLHQFLEVKHKIPPRDESLTASSMSHADYFNQYRECFGTTGTSGEDVERSEIMDIYHIDCRAIPPHIPSQRVLHPPELYDNEEQYLAALIKLIRVNTKAQRCTLILFESIKETEEFSQLLKTQKPTILHEVLNGIQKADESLIVAKAGLPGAVTIATNAAGRGTDFILSSTVKKNGGLDARFAKFPKSIRAKDQGFGRAGRQGQHGSCGLVLRKEKQDDTLDSLEWKCHEEAVNHSRTRRIYRAKTEQHFKRLQHFFDNMQQFYQLYEDQEFRAKLTVKAEDLLENNTQVIDCDIKYKKHWNTFVDSVESMLEKYYLNQQAFNPKLVINEFLTLCRYELLLKWGKFYSRLDKDTRSERTNQFFQASVGEKQEHSMKELEEIFANLETKLESSLQNLFTVAQMRIIEKQKALHQASASKGIAC